MSYLKSRTTSVLEKPNRAMRNTPEDAPSKFGLDHERSVVEKLFRTLILLLIAAFLGMFTLLVSTLVDDPWSQFALHGLLETCWMFWFLATVYVWWRPRWLRSHYLRAENRMFRLATVFKYGVIVLIVFAIGFLAYLQHIGALPAQPK